jgi:site-specific DNA-methyltransferase (adenine-specific)
MNNVGGPRHGFGTGFGDSGGASRFFYCAKASKKDRRGSKHPTIKPLALMRYLCRLITPPGGTVLDPFAGSGTTGEAAALEGFQSILIEREAEYIPDIEKRLGTTPEAPKASLDDLFEEN